MDNIPTTCAKGHEGHMRHRSGRKNSYQCLQCKREKTNAKRAENIANGLNAFGKPRSRRFTRTDEERFWEKVEVTGFCWLWVGAKSERGYGKFWNPERKLWDSAHRWAYKNLVLPELVSEQHLDHLCRIRNCVNPDHLEPVSNEENIRRGYGINRYYRERTHCEYGHEFNEENTLIRERGFRRCRACTRKS